MMCETPFISLVLNLLPAGSALIKPKNPPGTAPIQLVDLDGDGTPEVTAAYRYRGGCYVLVVKSCNSFRSRRLDIKGTGYDLDYLGFADIDGDGRKDLILGWKTGEIWSELSIFSWKANDLRKIVGGAQYSILDIEDISPANSRHGKAELALWSHAAGEAYAVDVLRWNGIRLVSAEDAYPGYFRKVAAYYEQKVREMPEDPIYWYYLADALIKSGRTDEALNAIEEGMRLNQGHDLEKDQQKFF